MGFSSGASSAKRKAKKAAADQYYKEFAKLSAVPELERVAATNKREVEDALGDDASFRTRNLSNKTDKLAREINKDDSYKQANKAYNDRYSILKDQIANKSTSRYSVGDDPGAMPEKQTNSFGGPSGINGFGQQNQNQGSGLADIAKNSLDLVKEKKQSTFGKGGSMYATKEEALADASKKMEAYNNSINGLVGKDKPRQQGTGMLSAMTMGNTKYSQQDIEAMRVKDPSRFIKEEKFDGFGALYRDLDKAESAANDFNTLGKNIMDSNGMKNVNAYAALAEKLKPMVKRDARNAQDKANTGQSLVSNELASATPYLESV
jgi:hypothetical protein